MSDSGIVAALSAILSPGVKTLPQQANIISLPQDLLQNTVIKGDITAVKDGQVTIHTDQGDVVVQTDANLQVGQKISFKLQNIVQNAVPQFLAEITLLPGAKINISAPVTSNTSITNTPTTPSTNAPLRNSVVQLSDLVEQFDHLDTIAVEIMQQPVQVAGAKTIALPQTLTEPDLLQLLRVILKLPPQQALPQTLTEGLDKFKILLPLLSAKAQLPFSTLTPQFSSLPRLTNLLQADGKMTATQESFAPLPKHPVVILQQVVPGQEVTHDILQAIKIRLSLIAPAGIESADEISAPMPEISEKTILLTAQKTETVFRSPVELLTALADKLLPHEPNETESATFQMPSLKNDGDLPTTSAPRLPLLGLVLGQTQIPALITLSNKPPAILFFMNAAGQNFITLAALPENVAQTELPLLPGSIVLAAVDAKAPLTLLTKLDAAAVQLTELPAFHPSLGTTWPALEEIWRSIVQQDHALPLSFLPVHQAMPRPEVQQLPGAILFFLSAVKNGFFSNWPTSDLPQLVTLPGKEILIAQLSNDLQTLQNVLRDDTRADAWRGIPVPLNVGDQLLRLQFFYRHPDETPRDSDTPDFTQKRRKKTRFLVDVPKTKFGDLQIDGLVQEKTLDIILRTEDGLQSDKQNAIRERYQIALETSGFAGGISFQSGKQHYVHA